MSADVFRGERFESCPAWGKLELSGNSDVIRKHS